MTKEKLRQYRWIDDELSQIEEEIQELNIYSVKAVILDDMPRRRGIQDSTRIIDKLIDLKHIYEQKWDALIDMKTEIERAIDKLQPLERQLIRLYYIKGLSWEQVCCEIGYSWAQTHRIHGKILKALKDDTQ